MLAEEIRTSWNTLIPYMEQIAALMQEKLDRADIHSIPTHAVALAVTTL